MRRPGCHRLRRPNRPHRRFRSRSDAPPSQPGETYGRAHDEVRRPAPSATVLCAGLPRLRDTMPTLKMQEKKQYLLAFSLPWPLPLRCALSAEGIPHAARPIRKRSQVARATGMESARFADSAPPPTPPHNVADLSDSAMAGSVAATLRSRGARGAPRTLTPTLE